MDSTRRQFLGGAAALSTAAAMGANGAVGDGAADDTEALQKTIDTGGLLELPPGTYRITQPLVIDTTKRGYAGVRGAEGTARIVMAGPGPAIRVVGDHQGTAAPKTFQQHTWESERFPGLTGFEILGAHPEADGIELFRTVQATIRGVLIRECRHGIHLVTRNRNVIIADCHIYNGHDSGIFLDGCNLHQINIIGNHISYCKHGGIRQLNGDVHNVQITGNDIEYNSGYDGLSGEILLEIPDDGMTSEITIASNTIQATPDALGSNIVIIGRGDTNEPKVGSIAISGNILGSRKKNILVEKSFRAITISGNVIYSGTESNLHFKECARVMIGSNSIVPMSRLSYGKSGQCGILLEDCWECSLTGNIINGHEAGSEEQGGAVSLVRSRDISVATNQLMNPRYRGVYLEDAERCTVTGNTITETREERTMLAAVEVAGEGKGHLVQNNLMSKGSRGAVLCGEAAGVVTGNTVA